MVDGTGLENRHTRKGIGGSNPSLSAITLLSGSCKGESEAGASRGWANSQHRDRRLRGTMHHVCATENP